VGLKNAIDFLSNEAVLGTRRCTDCSPAHWPSFKLPDLRSLTEKIPPGFARVGVDDRLFLVVIAAADPNWTAKPLCPTPLEILFPPRNHPRQHLMFRVPNMGRIPFPPYIQNALLPIFTTIVNEPIPFDSSSQLVASVVRFGGNAYIPFIVDKSYTELEYLALLSAPGTRPEDPGGTTVGNSGDPAGWLGDESNQRRKPNQAERRRRRQQQEQERERSSSEANDSLPLGATALGERSQQSRNRHQDRATASVGNVPRFQTRPDSSSSENARGDAEARAGQREAEQALLGLARQAADGMHIPANAQVAGQVLSSSGRVEAMLIDRRPGGPPGPPGSEVTPEDLQYFLAMASALRDAGLIQGSATEAQVLAAARQAYRRGLPEGSYWADYLRGLRGASPTRTQGATVGTEPR
jgi:hypothetical protein